MGHEKHETRGGKNKDKRKRQEKTVVVMCKVKYGVIKTRCADMHGGVRRAVCYNMRADLYCFLKIIILMIPSSSMRWGGGASQERSSSSRGRPQKEGQPRLSVLLFHFIIIFYFLSNTHRRRLPPCFSF